MAAPTATTKAVSLAASWAAARDGSTAVWTAVYWAYWRAGYWAAQLENYSVEHWAGTKDAQRAVCSAGQTAGYWDCSSVPYLAVRKVVC